MTRAACTAAGIRRLEGFSPRREDVDAALAALRLELAEQERQALARWVADTTGEAEAALSDERWEEALELAARIRHRAGDTAGGDAIVERAQRGLDLRARRTEAARLVARGRELLRASQFDAAAAMAREALALVQDDDAGHALAAETEDAWQADRERRRREAEAARAEAEARRRAEEEARRRAEEEARREQEERERREAEARERQRAGRIWLAQQLARARASIDAIARKRRWRS